MITNHFLILTLIIIVSLWFMSLGIESFQSLGTFTQLSATNPYYYPYPYYFYYDNYYPYSRYPDYYKVWYNRPLYGKPLYGGPLYGRPQHTRLRYRGYY